MLKEYGCSRRSSLSWLIFAPLFLTMVIVTLASGSGSVRTFVDSTGREIVSRPDPFAADTVAFGMLMAAANLTFFLLTWNYRIIVSDEFLVVRSIFGERQIRWSDIPWCHVYGKGGVFIGNPNGPTTRLRLEFVRNRKEAFDEVTSRVPSVRRMRTRRGLVVAMLLLGCGAVLVASLFHILFAVLLSALVGAGIAFAFVSIESRVQQWQIVPIVTALYAGMGTLAFAVACITRSPSVTNIATMTVVLFGGWFYGFGLTRMHEGAMRGVIGPDWAREVPAQDAPEEA